MKKIILSTIAILASVSLMALTPTAVAIITMTGNTSGDFDKLTLAESTTDGFTRGYDNGYDSYQPDANVPGIYAISGTNRFSTCMSNDLDNQEIGIITGTDTEYTLTFASVSGRTLKIYDKETDVETEISNTGSYVFTADANTRIDNRFVLNFTPVTEICHRYGKLQVSGSKGQTIKVLNLDGSATSIADVVISSYFQEIDLAGLAAGQYKVEWNSQTLIIDVK